MKNIAKMFIFYVSQANTLLGYQPVYLFELRGTDAGLMPFYFPGAMLDRRHGFSANKC
jgi:hypothetical protein